MLAGCCEERFIKCQVGSGQLGSSSSQSSVWYLPLPLLLDISLSCWSLLRLLNATLSSTTSQLKCFYSSPHLDWHQCAPEWITADHSLQDGRRQSDRLVCGDASEIRHYEFGLKPSLQGTVFVIKTALGLLI